jgi:hypothetical protein
MANTFELIASSTVGSGGASSIDFTSIPSTYTDLVLKVSGRSNRVDTVDTIVIKPNGSTTSMTFRWLAGDGAAAASATTDRIYQDALNNTANTFGNAEIYIPNYAGSNYKSMSIDAVMEQNGTSANAGFQAQLWSNTAAITSINLAVGFGTGFLQYSTAYLYGIKNS